MKDLLLRLSTVKNEERLLKEQRELIEAEIYMALKESIPDDGQSTWNYENYKLTIKQNYSVTVDQEQAKMFPDLFKKEYKLSWSQYKKSEQKNILDNMVVVKMNKPTFSIEVR